MKKFIILLFIGISSHCFADAWDDLTYEQAEQVVEYLKKHPFIIDYCDCCDHEGAYAAEVFLYKVLSADITECNWNDEAFSVVVTVVALAQIPHEADGIDIKNPTRYKYEGDETIYMNYTWAFDETNQRAVPFFDVIDYQIDGDAEPCKSYTTFPNPFNTECAIVDIEYKKWYWKYFLQAQQ